MKAPAVLAVALFVACHEPSTPIELHELGELEYAMPSDWESKSRIEAGRKVVEWMPKDNSQKESIVLIYSETLPAMAKAGPTAIAPRLAEAQLALRGAFERPARFRSKSGVEGVLVDGSFIPPDQQRRYRRSHAALAAGDRMVHVLYTAERATNRATFTALLNSLQRKGA